MAELTSVGRATQKWAQTEGIAIEFFEQIESTNSCAKQNADKDPQSLKLYVSDHQTQGRGRQENKWFDARPGTSLLSSWSYPLATMPQHVTGPLLGLAVYRGVRQTWPNLEWSLKAPNDLYLGNFKVAGLLTESMMRGNLKRLIVGLGLNVSDHPNHVDHATHLTSDAGLGQAIDEQKWFEFMRALHNSFEEILPLCSRSEISEGPRDELLKALNAFPFKSETILEITPAGDLVTDSRTISWKDL